MWNEERGFGFITPIGGGEDVFVHRSALNEGVTLAVGHAVTYEAIWDERKRKDRAANVAVAAPGSGGGFQTGPSGGDRLTPATQSQTRPTSHNIVGAYADWAINREPMTPHETSGGGPNIVRHRLTVRDKAPKGSGNDVKKEEFQIVGDGSWDKRLYPAGPDKEEVVVIRPGGPGSRAECQRGKGHGRNWAVEGRPGTAFDILYDADTQMVSCELAFSEK